jgi:hypothetical protein
MKLSSTPHARPKNPPINSNDFISFIVSDHAQQECCHPWAEDGADDGSPLGTGASAGQNFMRRPGKFGGGEVFARYLEAEGDVCPEFSAKAGAGLIASWPGAWIGRGRQHQENKKTGLRGQRVTKKPGEFSNLVHL